MKGTDELSLFTEKVEVSSSFLGLEEHCLCQASDLFVSSQCVFRQVHTVNTNCCATAARLQYAVVTSTEVKVPLANAARSSLTVYFSVISYSRSVKAPDWRTVCFRMRLLLFSARGSLNDDKTSLGIRHSGGILLLHTCRFFVTRSSQGVWCIAIL
jgi:hypothetical protein